VARGGIPHATLVSGAAGLQLEIVARFEIGAGTKSGQFGLLVLAADDRSEYTAITLDVAREQLLLDRTHSGASFDCDVRATNTLATSLSLALSLSPSHSDRASPSYSDCADLTLTARVPA
jgi:hypothetical protein